MDAIKLNNHTISLSNLDKVWFPKSKITKKQILDYYMQVSNFLIPHVKNHLITMQRFPDGIASESFYQKNASNYFPAWLNTKAVKKENKEFVNYVICNNAATLVYLANQGVLTFHSWLSRKDKLYYPDRMIFDLDPSIDDFPSVRKAALLIKDIFDELKIPSFAMTTGSRGIHILIPLKRVHTFDEVGNFAYIIARKMLEINPGQFTLELRKEKRGKKIFIDTLRNRYSATAVAPYSVRPIEKAPVAAPLWWQEVNDSKLTSQKFNIKNILNRLKQEGDPWEKVHEDAISLKKTAKWFLERV